MNHFEFFIVQNFSGEKCADMTEVFRWRERCSARGGKPGGERAGRLDQRTPKRRLAGNLARLSERDRAAVTLTELSFSE